MDNSQGPLLLVDDDPVNLEILVDHLEDAGYQTVTAENGAEAWKLLQQDTSQFQAVLLDRMMPVMNGMEVLTKMKRHAALKILPVIMQTAAVSSDEIREGIEAGAFYYLTKPFTKEVLLAIVEAAVRDFTKYQSLQNEVAEQTGIFHCLDSAQFHFQTLEEVHTLSALLANACPEPNQVVVGLVDLFMNAVEHGNLQIAYHEKTQLQETGDWEAEIARRLTVPEFAHKTATVTFHRRTDHIEFIITDQGRGFDWRQHLELSPEQALSTHGRGIALARSLSFDLMEYRGVGNEVVCTINLSEMTPQESESANSEPALMLQNS